MIDQFSEEQARQIFARAAERQHAAQPRGEGLTLAELEAIGAEAGLDPEHIGAAVAEMHLLPGAEPYLVNGIDVTPRRARVLPVDLTDEMWERMVSRLRRTYHSKGVPSRVGRIREWQSAAGSNLHVVAEPVEGGTRITLESSKEQFVRSGNAPNHGLYPAVGIAAALSVFFAVGDFGPYVWLVPVVISLLGVAYWLLMQRHLSRWAETRLTQFDGLLDQFELIARDADGGIRRGLPDLDLDALGPAPDAAARRSRRTLRE